jgi:hypothetical protein
MVNTPVVSVCSYEILYNRNHGPEEGDCYVSRRMYLQGVALSPSFRSLGGAKHSTRYDMDTLAYLLMTLTSTKHFSILFRPIVNNNCRGGWNTESGRLWCLFVVQNCVRYVYLHRLNITGLLESTPTGTE